MKIFVSSLTYPLTNGVTISINTAMDGFLKRGHKIRVVSPDYGVGKSRPEHYPVPYSVITKGIGVLLGKEERAFGAKAYSEIKKIAEDFKPDAYWLHTLTWGTNAFERLMLKSSKPKVLFYHTLVEEYGKIYAGEIGAFTMRKRSKIACNKMDAIMTPSQMMKKKLESYGVVKPINVIPTGIGRPPKPFENSVIKTKYGIPSDHKILLYVGRVSKEKNLKVLLRTMRDLKRLKFKAALLLVGPGDIKEVKKDAEKMGVGDLVVFSGPLSKKETLRTYGSCDAFVFSSKTETQGLVIGEAMAAKIPVIALQSPIQEEVYPEDTAVVIREEKDFASQIIEIMKNSKKRKAMTQRAESFVLKNFTKQRMIEKQIKVFKDLMK